MDTVTGAAPRSGSGRRGLPLRRHGPRDPRGIWWVQGGAVPMEASAGLVAVSHNRNELVVIRRDGEPGVSSLPSPPPPSLIPPGSPPNACIRNLGSVSLAFSLSCILAQINAALVL